MGLLDPYVQAFHTDVMPHIRSAGERAVNYGERICHRLDCIHRELALDREPGEVIAVQFTLPADNSAVSLVLVPAGEEYVLECFSGDAAANARLFSDGSFRLQHTLNGVGASLRLQPVRFVGPCTITAATAGGIAVNGYVQLRRLAKRARPTHSGGLIETGLDVGPDARRTHDPLHSGMMVGA